MDLLAWICSFSRSRCLHPPDDDFCPGRPGNGFFASFDQPEKPLQFIFLAGFYRIWDLRFVDCHPVRAGLQPDAPGDRWHAGKRGGRVEKPDLDSFGAYPWHAGWFLYQLARCPGVGYLRHRLMELLAKLSRSGWSLINSTGSRRCHNDCNWASPVAALLFLRHWIW